MQLSTETRWLLLPHHFQWKKWLPQVCEHLTIVIGESLKNVSKFFKMPKGSENIQIWTPLFQNKWAKSCNTVKRPRKSTEWSSCWDCFCHLLLLTSRKWFLHFCTSKQVQSNLFTMRSLSSCNLVKLAQWVTWKAFMKMLTDMNNDRNSGNDNYSHVTTKTLRVEHSRWYNALTCMSTCISLSVCIRVSPSNANCILLAAALYVSAYFWSVIRCHIVTPAGFSSLVLSGNQAVSSSSATVKASHNNNQKLW